MCLTPAKNSTVAATISNELDTCQNGCFVVSTARTPCFGANIAIRKRKCVAVLTQTICSVG